jgi:hypothetical protein
MSKSFSHLPHFHLEYAFIQCQFPIYCFSFHRNISF